LHYPAETCLSWRLEWSRDKRAKNERIGFTSCDHVEGRMLTAVRQANNMCLARTAHSVARLVPANAAPRPARGTDRKTVSPSQRSGMSTMPVCCTASEAMAESLFLIQTGVFDLDRTAAFMYISRVLLDRSKARRRAVERPCPTVLSPRLRQTEREDHPGRVAS
jgi:hypothetical protein